MAPNVISNKLESKTFLGEHVSKLPAFGNYLILMLHDYTQNLFGLPCTEMPLTQSLTAIAV